MLAPGQPVRPVGGGTGGPIPPRADASWMPTPSRAWFAGRPPRRAPWARLPLAVASIDFVKRPEVLQGNGGRPVGPAGRGRGAPVRDRRRTAAAALDWLARRARRVVLLTATPHAGDDGPSGRCAHRAASPGEAAHHDVPPDAGRASAARRRGACGSPGPALGAAEGRLHRRSAGIRRPRLGRTRAPAARPKRPAGDDRPCKRGRVGPGAAARVAQAPPRLARGPRPGRAGQLSLPLGDDPDRGDEEPAAVLAAPGLARRTARIGASCERWSSWRASRVRPSTPKTRALLPPARRVRASRRSSSPSIATRWSTWPRAWRRSTTSSPLHGGLDRRRARGGSRVHRGRRPALLLATDAAAHGLNLQARCRLVVNLDLPWNPVRLEQRIGRVDRIGQHRMVHAVHLVGARHLRGRGARPPGACASSRCAQVDRTWRISPLGPPRGAGRGRAVVDRRGPGAGAVPRRPSGQPRPRAAQDGHGGRSPRSELARRRRSDEAHGCGRAGVVSARDPAAARPTFLRCWPTARAPRRGASPFAPSGARLAPGIYALYRVAVVDAPRSRCIAEEASRCSSPDARAARWPDAGLAARGRRRTRLDAVAAAHARSRGLEVAAERQHASRRSAGARRAGGGRGARAAGRCSRGSSTAGRSRRRPKPPTAARPCRGNPARSRALDRRTGRVASPRAAGRGPRAWRRRPRWRGPRDPAMPDGISGSLVSEYFLDRRSCSGSSPASWATPGDAGRPRALPPVVARDRPRARPGHGARASTTRRPCRSRGSSDSSPPRQADAPTAAVLVAGLAAGTAARLASSRAARPPAGATTARSTWRRAVRWNARRRHRLVPLHERARAAPHRHPARAAPGRYLEFDLEASSRRPGVVRASSGRCCGPRPSTAPGDGLPPPLIDRVVLASARAHGRRLPVPARRRAATRSATVWTRLLPAAAARQPPARARPGRRCYEQALTIVYRVLFLLFAESRGLVPTVASRSTATATRWRPLRDLAERAARPAGLWETLQAMSRLAHAGCRAGTLRVTPFNGRLFAPVRHAARRVGPPGRRVGAGGCCSRSRRRPGARRRRAGAHRLPRPRRRAARAPSTRACSTTAPVAAPASAPRRARRGAAPDRRRAGSPARPGRGPRKATGTFYTPRSITDVPRPARARAARARTAPPERILALRVLDPVDGQRRLPRGRLPVPRRRLRGGARRRRRRPPERHRRRGPPRLPPPRRAALPLRRGPATRWPCSSRASRCGCARSRPTGR